jgi:class 3 adenylate cyclase/GTPase SAR1 family protein
MGRRRKAGSMQPDESPVRRQLPDGVSLLRTLGRHPAEINCLAWSPDGKSLASGSSDGTVRLWDFATGRNTGTYSSEHSILTVAFHPSGSRLASAGTSHDISITDLNDGTSRTLTDNGRVIQALSWSFDGRYLASSGDGAAIWDTHEATPTRLVLEDLGDEGLHNVLLSLAWNSDSSRLAGASYQTWLWDTANKRVVHRMAQNEGFYDVKWSPDTKSNQLAAGSAKGTIIIWDQQSGRAAHVLEGHTSDVRSVSFSSDGRLLASRADDETIRLWSCDDWRELSAISAIRTSPRWHGGTIFHPSLPILAAIDMVGPRDQAIHLFEVFPDVLRMRGAKQGRHYVNAKVVLVGDTGVGKSGLTLVLSRQDYAETDSTAGRHVELFDSHEAIVGNNVSQTRETLLWDLAGQPGYRVIHQLHLNEVAVALVVFDSRSETDPLAGVRHWERALRVARQRQGSGAVPMKTFLVSARNDRGGVSISEERLKAILKEFLFDGYFKTSAREGWQIQDLRAAIESAIPWEGLPVVSSSQLFADIKEFLLAVKKTGRLLAPEHELYSEFRKQHSSISANTRDLEDQFATCIGRLANRDLIRRLTFGGYVLLQPELLDAYASAMVNAAKEEPDGLGSLAEEIALSGRFFVPKEQKVADRDQEQLLLHATVEELVSHDLALRETADDGRYLVFPSQFNRDYEDAPEPKGKAVAITFDGPTQSLYAALAVRLGHSGAFTTGRTEMWRNAAVFTAKAGGKCGVLLQEFTEGRGRLLLFYDEAASDETRFHFEEFVLAHTKRRALDGSVELLRFFVCPNGHPVPNEYVELLRAQGITEFDCPCKAKVSLVAPAERVQFQSQVAAMNASADKQRNLDAFVVSAKGETSTNSFHEWAGGARVTLAIVFTDVVGSTALGEEVREEGMSEIRQAHFAQSRKLIEKYKGREIKTIGDSFMATFKSVDAALDYACALHEQTGHPQVQIRAGIHIGPMQVEEEDVFGGAVNFAARVVGAIKDSEIWLSEPAKDDIDRLGAKRHKHLKWVRHDHIVMKGFPGEFVLWSLS